MIRLSRIWAWTRFMLLEYLRSGRILAELVALAVFSYVFLRRPNVDAILTATQFFSMTALFVLVQTVYTTGVLITMAQRAQSYVVLAKPIGRRGYILGIFLAAIIIGVANFVACSAIVTLINRPQIWDVVIWAAGALPLVLDIAFVAALVILLSGLVLSHGWRLAILALVAFGSLSSADLLGPDLDAGTMVGRILGALRTIVALPLMPLFSGFELAARREAYEESLQLALAILGGQVALTLAVLMFALYAFDRRDIVLS